MTAPASTRAHRSTSSTSLLPYLGAIAACAATTGLATLLLLDLDLANIVMVFLLTVVLVAVWLGRGPAILAAVLSVALFDFFFVPPRFSFTVHDVQYLLTFAVMLVVALVFGELTARISEQAQVGDTPGQASSLRVAGNAASELNRHESALDFLRKSAAIDGKQNGVARTRVRIAREGCRVNN